ncbi:ribosome small subunit-dependent GTPase A [Haloplasma contractile]|uniref:Small ribosomal subunit biogenesis GTPase RsgA n=1 Tax=Haloplasma contractile SSD-17B TaxID=1033810 RepID=U2DYW1_9MOLU|nr:ribosome small subunit-dependent GTPase A [Haloplasma contractile]ERJ13427.1 Putative ribosome biosis GTPase RsgA protein [Haloplasma contractile SSD-17B]
MARGLILKALSGYYYVIEEETKKMYTCRGRGNFRNKKLTPLVGDQVEFQIEDHDEGYILKLLKRKNSLVRPPVANVDQVLLVFSAKDPDFSQHLLDRFLTVIEHVGIEPVIIVSKIDLLEEVEYDKLKTLFEYYREIGYTVIEQSAKTKANLEHVIDVINGNISVLAGQSGVGKSSMLNAINPEFNIKTDIISKALNRGKHTTRHVELLTVYDGLIADTPGFSSLEFLEMEKEDLPGCFIDFARIGESCKFRGCFHINEPKCEVKNRLGEHDVYDKRYAHYSKFYEELKSQKPKY